MRESACRCLGRRIPHTRVDKAAGREQGSGLLRIAGQPACPGQGRGMGAGVSLYENLSTE